MKKIVSAVALTALAGSLFAADASIKLNARTKITAYEKTTVENATAATPDTVTIGKTTTTTNDSMDVELKNDRAGAHVTLALKPNETTEKQVQIDSKYWGWMSWGAFNVTAGKFESLFTKKGNTTLVEEGLTDKDEKSYGLSSWLKVDGAAIGKTFMFDANTITANAGTRVTSVVADYTFADVLDGKLLVKVGLIDALKTADYRTDNANDDTKQKTVVGSGAVFDVALQRNDFWLEGMVRTNSYKNVVAGLYATLNKDLIPLSTVRLGFTYGSASKTTVGANATNLNSDNKLSATSDNAAFNAYAIDFRYTVNPTDQLQVVLNAKYESLTPKFTEKDDAETGFYLAGQIGYKLNDLINLALDGRLVYADLDDNDELDQAENWFYVRPAVEFKAGSAAKITAALEYGKALNTGDVADGTTTSTLSVPVIFRVKL